MKTKGKPKKKKGGQKLLAQQKSNYDMRHGGKVDDLAFTVSSPCFIRKHGVVAHSSLGSMGSIFHMKDGEEANTQRRRQW